MTVRVTPTMRVFVQNSFFLNSPILQATGTAIQPLTVGYAGTTAVNLGARLGGAFTAPNASVTFGAGPNPQTYSGSYVARSIEVAPGSILVCHWNACAPAVPTWPI